MSFYGNIINYFTKAFKTIKVGNETFEANIFEDEVVLTDALNNLLEISIEKDDNDSDNKLIYHIKQNGQNKGTIDIPLDLILADGEVIKEEGTGEWGNPGTYLKLVLKTSESETKNVYINVQ
jgi:hypothetical protein